MSYPAVAVSSLTREGFRSCAKREKTLPSPAHARPRGGRLHWLFHPGADKHTDCTDKRGEQMHPDRHLGQMHYL